MWQEWREVIDRSLRDADLARDKWEDHEFRRELRRDPEQALSGFRLFRMSTLPHSEARGELPRSWRMRLIESRARPIL